MVKKVLTSATYNSKLAPLINQTFYLHLLYQTEGFHSMQWMEHQIFQSVFDAWIVAEVVAEIKPALLIECGTYRGGSALFYADLLTLLGTGQVISIDVKQWDTFERSNVEFWLGSSTSSDIVNRAREATDACEGPVMVVLDSDHRRAHVLSEMECYSPFVTTGSYMMVQDGMVDVLPRWTTAGLPGWRDSRPGPLVAIREFIEHHPEFEVDFRRSNQFLISQSPMGWLRRR
jgi:cephalosporin hydroxylase